MSQGMALVTFKTHAVEDREKSISTGHWVGKDIDIVCITPVGGRLVHEQEVTEDLLRVWKSRSDEKYRYDAYMAWKEGEEPPVNGQDLKNWPPISPAQVKQFNSRQIRSVEELAEIPDDYLQSFGPGSRALRDKARDWIKSSGETGKIVAEIGTLRDQVSTLKEDNAKLRAINEQLLDKLASDDAPKRGRPKVA